jgi:hypothetical protein
MSVAGLGPRARDGAHPAAPAAHEHTLPPAERGEKETRLAKRRPALAGDVPLDKAARVVGDVKRMAGHAALGMAHLY